MSNQDSQDELKELMMTALDAYESTDMQLDDIVNEWVKRFNAHTQKAVTEARIDELFKACQKWEYGPNLPATYLIDRKAELTEGKQ